MGNNNQSATNPCRRFRYDNSQGFKPPIPTGINPTYMLGRMVEAATDNCGTQTDPVLTDEWFSYDADGNQKDIYESTPNSGGWYHVSDSHWNDGALGTRVGYLGTGSTVFSNSLNYVVDGEGRLSGLWDGTISKSIWWGTTLNSAGQPDTVNFYNGDSESFNLGLEYGTHEFMDIECRPKATERNFDVEPERLPLSVAAQ